MDAPTGGNAGRNHELLSLLPNKRLKLAGPAFRGNLRLCACQQVTQGGALAPTGVRPAA